MIWHTLRFLLTFLLPAFYKRIQAKNIDFLKVKQPVIIAMNHPNAFTDPIYITYLAYPQRLSFLARGDAFKPGLITFLLEKIGIVPIFRIQDGGKEGLKKNEEAYQRVNYLLGNNSKIIVFAEGLCIQERRLRPLKKGVARMVFGAYEALQNDQLLVIPVGVNYSKPDKFRSTIFYNVGEAIPVKDFMAEYKDNPARTYNTFLQELEPKMKALITHIDSKENDELVYQVEELCKKDWLNERQLNFKNLADDFEILQLLTEKINQTARNNPGLLEEIKPLAKQYFQNLKSNKLKDWLINPKQNKRVNYVHLCLRYLVLLAGLPIYLIGLIGNYFPFILTHLITKKSIKAVEFYSSIAIGVGMFIFWINYVLWFFLVYSFASTIILPVGVCFLLFGSAWFSIYYHPFMKKTVGMHRLLKNRTLWHKLSAEREKLIALINKF